MLDCLKLASQVPTCQETSTRKLYFTVLDTWNGYHNIGLSEDTKNYFGFATEWGTYTYNVAPQGFLGSGDYYMRRMDEIMKRIHDKHQNELVNPAGKNNDPSTTWV